MIKNLGHGLVKFVSTIGGFFIKTDVGRVLGSFTAIVVLLETIGVWEELLKFLSSSVKVILSFLLRPMLGIPLYFWLLSLALFVWLLRRDRYLNLVAGEFSDTFSRGLEKWEYGSDGWRTEQEDGKPLLSVSESPDGGISKKGFSWSDYEFSFKNEVISKNAGWIVRAENRNKYIMVQLWMEEHKQPKLRLHYRIPDKWIVAEETQLNNEKSLKLLEWINVKLVVLGSNIDVYLNNQHCAHYFIPDPFVWNGTILTQEGEAEVTKKSITISTNYPVGKVGFRCSGSGEHAHFRDVKVKPLT